MTSEERAKRVRNYFAEPPKVPFKDLAKAVVGLILILVGVHVPFLLLVGLALLVWGGFGVVRYARDISGMQPKATDQEMDTWLAQALPPLVLEGGKRLNVHPTELAGPAEESYLVFVGFPNIEEVKIKRGDDGKIRYSNYEILVVFLSNWRLPVYEVNYDMEHDITVSDNTKEYNLGQVDGIETFSDRINVLSAKGDAGKQGPPSSGVIGHVTRAQMLSLMVSGNRAVTLVVGIAGSESVKIENAGDSSMIDSGISRLREHLRARHQGAYPAGAGLPAGGPASLGSTIGLGLDLPPQAAPRPGTFGPDPGSPALGSGR